jgi:hypothetical protein
MAAEFFNSSGRDGPGGGRLLLSFLSPSLPHSSVIEYPPLLPPEFFPEALILAVFSFGRRRPGDEWGLHE